MTIKNARVYFLCDKKQTVKNENVLIPFSCGVQCFENFCIFMCLDLVSECQQSSLSLFQILYEREGDRQTDTDRDREAERQTQRQTEASSFFKGETAYFSAS